MQDSLKSQEAIALNVYICDLYGTKTVPYLISKQIDDYIKQLNYSHSGIQKTLNYFYDILGNTIDSECATIGIVPYVYEEAAAFYKSLFDIEATNVDFVAREQTKSIKVVPKERAIPCTTKIEEL